MKILLNLVILVGLTGCSVISSATAISPHGSQTPDARPTASQFSTIPQTHALPSLTPEPGLRTDGPYLGYFRHVPGFDAFQFVLMDSDGKGRKAVNLPVELADSFSEFSQVGVQYISPDGKWLAFYTGYAGEIYEEAAVSTFDLTLNLLELDTGETRVIAQLLSKDYPENFIEATDELNNPHIISKDLQDAFLAGITSALAWSPDGRYLAFAGQMDGLSSDLYLYDTQSNTIRRLTNENQELQWISWSPDGSWIIFGSVYSVGMGMTFDTYAVSLDGMPPRYISTNSLYTGVHKWLNSHAYFEYDSQNSLGVYGLRLVDIKNGSITRLWDGSYFSYEIDRDGEQVIVNAMLPDISPTLSRDDLNFRPGPYLIDLKTLRKTKIEFPPEFDWRMFVAGKIIPFGLSGQEFMLMDNTTQLYFMSENLELTPLDLKNAEIFISPDLESWVAVTGNSINLYSADNILLNTVVLNGSNTSPCDFIWAHDSNGLFQICGSNLYFVDLLSGSIHLVERYRKDMYMEPGFIWVNDW